MKPEGQVRIPSGCAVAAAIFEEGHRSASDVVKAIALGADACYITTAALLAMGCHLCRTCQSCKYNWGIVTQRPDLVKRMNPEISSQRLVNPLTAWNHEIKELVNAPSARRKSLWGSSKPIVKTVKTSG